MTREPKECDDCGGGGEAIYTSPTGDYDYERCRTCGGSGVSDADKLFRQLAPVIGAWRAYSMIVDRQPYMFDMPRHKPTFEGFMGYLSRQFDNPAADLPVPALPEEPPK